MYLFLCGQTRGAAPTCGASFLNPSSLGPQDVCIAHILRSGAGKLGLKLLLDEINGPSDSNDMMAEYLLEETKDFPFMNNNQ